MISSRKVAELYVADPVDRKTRLMGLTDKELDALETNTKSRIKMLENDPARMQKEQAMADDLNGVLAECNLPAVISGPRPAAVKAMIAEDGRRNRKSHVISIETLRAVVSEVVEENDRRCWL